MKVYLFARIKDEPSAIVIFWPPGSVPTAALCLAHYLTLFLEKIGYIMLRKCALSHDSAGITTYPLLVYMRDEVCPSAAFSEMANSQQLCSLALFSLAWA